MGIFKDSSPLLPRTRVYLASWLVVFPAFALGWYLFGLKGWPMALLFLITVIVGIGAISGLALVKGLPPAVFAGSAVLVPLQPLVLGVLALLPAKSGSELDQFKRTGGRQVNLTNPSRRLFASMTLQQRRLWMIGFICAVCLFGFLYYGYSRYSALSEEGRGHTLEIAGIGNLPEIEKRFSESPTLPDCLWLVDKIGNVQKNYLKAIKYGNECLLLPGSEENSWLIDFWLASLYNKTNDSKNAKEHLDAAIRNDNTQLIKNSGWIESEGLESLYAEIAH